MAFINSSSSHDAYAVFKLSFFRNFLIAKMCLTFAIQMQSVIVGWQVYEYTKDALSLGLIGLAEAIPFIAVALFAGHVADVANRKKIILISVFTYLFAALALFLLTFKFSFLLKNYGIIPIYIIIFITGISRGFLFPAQSALMTQLIHRDLYANSSTWNSLGWHISAISGPAIGGLIYGFWGINIAYLTVLIFTIIAISFYLKLPDKPVPAKEKHESLFESLRAGINFVFKNQIILSALSIDMFAIIFGGAIAVLPIFVAEILHVGPEGLGFLRAAPAAGAVFMAIVLAYHPPLHNAGQKLFFTVAGFGVCFIFFALSTNFYLSLFILVLTGMFDNVSVIIRGTIIQLFTPDEMRGRVASINSVFAGSSNEISSFESGVAARFLGLVPSVIFGGIMTILIVSSIVKLSPKLQTLDLEHYIEQK